MLALVGMALAAYLTWVHFDSGALVCGLGDCRTVQASEFATVGPVPVALLGFGMYAAVLACTLVARMWPALAVTSLSLAFAMALAGTAYAAYLTWLEVAVIGAICQWCVASAIVTALLALVTALAVWRSLALDEASETGSARAASLQVDPAGRGTTGAGR